MASEYVQLACLPEAGGKITSLRTPHGPEWLWSNPRLPVGRPVYGSDYGRDLDSGGWDEVLPSVAAVARVPSDWPGPVPDHGEFVGLAASVVPDAVASNRLTVALQGRQWPLQLERTLHAGEGQSSVSVRYSLRNTANSPLPYLYAAHLLLAVDQGVLIELPEGQEWRVYAGLGAAKGLAGRSGRWPSVETPEGSKLDLSHLLVAASQAGAEPLALKVFVRMPSDGRMRIRRGDGSSLTLCVDPAELPWLGLWINRNGWAGTDGPGYLNLGLEPTTAPTDDLEAAVRDGTARWLAGGATVAWGLQLDLA